MLSLIDLPTVVIAAHLAASTDLVPVVPVPASLWTPSKPGQVSQRIAIDAAVLSGREYLDVLTRSDNGMVCKVQGNGLTVTLVDDQLTHGGSVSSAVTALTRAGFNVRAVLTWSASGRHWIGAPSITTKCWLAEARLLLGRGGACDPRHLSDIPDDVDDVARCLDSVRL